jgi:hypothetical protein
LSNRLDLFLGQPHHRGDVRIRPLSIGMIRISQQQHTRLPRLGGRSRLTPRDSRQLRTLYSREM